MGERRGGAESRGGLRGGLGFGDGEFDLGDHALTELELDGIVAGALDGFSMTSFLRSIVTKRPHRLFDVAGADRAVELAASPVCRSMRTCSEDSLSATDCASFCSLALRAAMTFLWCSTWRTLRSVASTARPCGIRKLRP